MVDDNDDNGGAKYNGDSEGGVVVVGECGSVSKLYSQGCGGGNGGVW